MVVSASRTTNIAGSAGGETGAATGVAAVIAAAIMNPTIHHPPEANGTGLSDARIAGRTNFRPRRRPPVPSSHSAHQTPQPGTSKDGHHLIKKCLAKSVKTLRFVGGYPQFGSA